jgi:hypothetical protein
MQNEIKIKKGYVRPDGMVFWQHDKRRNKDQWITQDQYNSYRKKCLDWHKKKRQTDLDAYNKKARLYYKENKEKILRANKEYARKNHEKTIRDKSKYQKERIKRDPLYKLKLGIRSLISISIKGLGYTKKSRTHEILGCSFQQFKLYIEQRFQKGMTWENRSEWHLDHIIPVSSAKSEQEIIKLNHYTNFRPLWAKENLRKSNKMPTHLVRISE